jgi:hypothetical protein
MPRKTKQPTPQQLARMLVKMAEAWRERKDKFKASVESVQGHSPHEKAEAWVRYCAQNMEDDGDQEALLYLVSRGHDCTAEINKLVAEWRHAERHRIEAAKKFVHYVMPGKAARISGLSEFELRNFWGPAHDCQGYSIDATMLRTVGWCQIGGFEEWWRRMAKMFREGILRGGVETVPAASYLFNMCRSDYAIKLMKPALERCLEAIEIPTDDPECPWRFLPYSVAGKRRPVELVGNLAFASWVAFANFRLRGRDFNRDLVTGALEELLRHQDENGAWRSWAHDQEPSIEATASAVHALGLGKPLGWERVVDLAVAWLWTVQQKSGCWVEDGCPDPAYLTVLVLDAIELSKGGHKVTFSVPDLLSGGASEPSQAQPGKPKLRFEVGLSFPGEIRGRVAAVAGILSERLGRQNVLYDDYHKAEFARPDLDTYLQSLYHDQTQLIVVFLCSDYKKKEWCGLEWRAIRDLIKRREAHRIMLLRTDEALLPPGMYSIDGYLDIRGLSDRDVAASILTRLNARAGAKP